MIVSFDSNTTGVTIGSESTNPIRAPVFIFYWVRIAQSLFFVDACVEHYSKRLVSLVEWDLLTISLVLFLISGFFLHIIL